MDVYRRIAIAKNEKDLSQLRDELADLFGKIPTQVDDLLDLTELRIAAASFGIRSITVMDLDLIFSFEDGASAKELFERAPGRVSVPDPKTVHLRLEKNYFEPATIKSVLRKLLKLKTTNRPRSKTRH
jgi:transcription-repair coupling factor (superfamily II helicase)